MTGGICKYSLGRDMHSHEHLLVVVVVVVVVVVMYHYVPQQFPKIYFCGFTFGDEPKLEYRNSMF